METQITHLSRYQHVKDTFNSIIAILLNYLKYCALFSPIKAVWLNINHVSKNLKLYTSNEQ